LEFYTASVLREPEASPDAGPVTRLLPIGFMPLSLFHDGYKERIEALIKSKMKGEVAQVEEKRPKKPVAKSLMEAPRETAESLK
jgi:hypothetical protein